MFDSEEEAAFAATLAVVLVISVGVIVAHNTGSSEIETEMALVVEESMSDRPGGEVVSYASLSESEQQAFRKAVGSVGGVAVSDGAMEGVEYVSLDGQYYRVDVDRNVTLGGFFQMLVLGVSYIFAIITATVLSLAGIVLVLKRLHEVLSGVLDWGSVKDRVWVGVERVGGVGGRWTHGVIGLAFGVVGSFVAGVGVIRLFGPIVYVHEVSGVEATVSASSFTSTMKVAFVEATGMGLVFQRKLPDVVGEYVQSDGEVYAVSSVSGVDALVLVFRSLGASVPYGWVSDFVLSYVFVAGVLVWVVVWIAGLNLSAERE